MTRLRNAYRLSCGLAAVTLVGALIVGLILAGPLVLLLAFFTTRATNKLTMAALFVGYLAAVRWLIREASAAPEDVATLHGPPSLSDQLTRAKVRTELARARELRSRATHRVRTRAEQEKAERRAYVRGASDAA